MVNFQGINMKRPSIGMSDLFGLLLAVAVPIGAKAADGDKRVTAVEFQRKTIYHSPQTPGFTCWTGTWLMPDGSIMVCFTQATGPLEGRPRAPKEVLHKLSWPPKGDARYDMTGLDLRNVHLRSADGGATWEQVSADPFKSPMNGCTGQCETALRDGTVIRGVWGHYLPFDPQLPKTGFLQRSQDATKTWSKPHVLLDPTRRMAWPKRLRVLKDGRLIVVGGIAAGPANSKTRVAYCKLLEPLLMVSADGGKTWSQPIDVVPPEHRKGWGGEEFDAAELPNGDLLCVFRRFDSKVGREVRWQGLLAKKGEIWVPASVGPAPFPHSGHPELLACREGVVLHLTTSGTHWTQDGGQSWHRLNIPGSHYYPRSVQARDGRIHVFAHVGSDNAYGTVDQSIVMDTFRLNVR
jgi:hypothetical protein